MSTGPGDVARHSLVLHDVEVPLPPGWSDRSQLIVVAGAEQGFRPNLVVVRDTRKNGEDAEQFATRNLAGLADIIDDYQLISHGWETIGEHAGFLREQEIVADDKIVRQLQFSVVHGNWAYVFTFTHLASRFDAVAAEARALIAGTRIASAGSGPTDEFEL